MGVSLSGLEIRTLAGLMSAAGSMCVYLKHVYMDGVTAKERGGVTQARTGDTCWQLQRALASIGIWQMAGWLAPVRSPILPPTGPPEP